MPDQMHPTAAAFLERADRLFGDGYSGVLHGSLVRGDFLPDRSDVNLLVVTDQVSVADLREISAQLALFEQERMSPPLLIPRSEWECAADVFPIEITDIRSAYRVVRGADPVMSCSVRPRDLQRALESELRGKLLRLRLDYGLYHADEDRLAAVVGYSVGSIRVLLRSALALAGVPSPASDTELAREASGMIRLDHAPLERVLAHRRNPSWRCPRQLFESYVGVVEQATRFVDGYHAGDQ